jgi:lysophospholipase L1-like esterase
MTFGCGGSNTSSTGISNPAIDSVTVVCNPSGILVTQSSQCSAILTGTGAYSIAVTWSATGGTISTSGAFIGSATGNATVTATSTEDVSKTGSANIAVTPTGVSNFTPSSLPKWRTALSKVLSGQRRAKIACIGDSATVGIGSYPIGFNNIKVNAWPSQLASQLASSGIPADSASFFADSGVGSYVSMQTADPRITLSSDWGVNSSYVTIGGIMLANITSTSPLTFNPGITIDSADIYDYAPSSQNTWSAGFDGSYSTNPITALAVRKTTITTSNGMHTVYLQPSGTGVFLIGIDAYNSTQKDIAVWNMGYADSTTGDWAGNSNPYDPMSMLAFLSPDLTIIDLGIIDMGQGVSVDTFTKNMQTIITTALQSGDVIIVVPAQVDPVYISADTQSAFRSALYSLASQYNVPVFDITQVFGDFATANSNGLMFNESHPDQLGYAQIAAGLAWPVSYTPH